MRASRDFQSVLDLFRPGGADTALGTESALTSMEEIDCYADAAIAPIENIAMSCGSSSGGFNALTGETGAGSSSSSISADLLRTPGT